MLQLPLQPDKIVQDFWEKITNQSRSSTESNKAGKDKDVRRITFFVDGTVKVHSKLEKAHVATFYTDQQKIKGEIYLCVDPREVNMNIQVIMYKDIYNFDFAVQVLKFLTQCQKCTTEELVGKDSDKVRK
jgi:hypothetical protein